MRAADPAVDEAVKGRARCPRCACRKVLPVADRTIELCANCGTAWEPLPNGGRHLDSDGTPFPFPDPCDNCAFRPGSREQKSTAEWRALIDKLRSGGRFYCHKGVPFDLKINGEFAFPRDRNGNPIEHRMRICRGYLNALQGWWNKSGDAARPVDEVPR